MTTAIPLTATKTTTPIITTVAGTGTAGYGGDNGPATSAQLNHPTDVAVDSAGTLYIADWGSHRVRKVTGVAGAVAPVTGTVVMFVNVRSGLVVEVQGESVGEGAEIHQYTNTGKNHQRWRLTIVDQDNGRDVYTLENVNSGKVIEVVQASAQPGEILVQRTYGGKAPVIISGH